MADSWWAMTFNWHTADRDEVVEEGKRLEAENTRLWARGVEAFDRVKALEKELMLRRENEAKLKGTEAALAEVMRENTEAREALEEIIIEANRCEDRGAPLPIAAPILRKIRAVLSGEMSKKSENIDASEKHVDAETKP